MIFRTELRVYKLFAVCRWFGSRFRINGTFQTILDPIDFHGIDIPLYLLCCTERGNENSLKQHEGE